MLGFLGLKIVWGETGVGMKRSQMSKEKDGKEKDTLAFRAPVTLISTIKEVARDLEVSDSELIRCAIEKGLGSAVDEIQDEKMKAAKDLIKRLKEKGKTQLNFEFPCNDWSLHGSACPA